MPVLKLMTNVKDIPDTFIKNASKVISQLTGKEESRVLVSVMDNVKISFGGSSDPAAFVEFLSTGMDVNDHPKLSKSIAELLEDIGVPKNRHYISFSAPLPTHIGKAGTTISERTKALDITQL